MKLKNLKQGFVISIVSIFTTLIIITLTIMIANQKDRIDIIQSFKEKDKITQQFLASELVLMEILQKQINLHSSLDKLNDKKFTFITPEEGKISINLKISDNCYNVNSLIYKTYSGDLDVNHIEYNRVINIIKQLGFNPQIIENYIDWIDKNQTNKNGQTEEKLYISSNLPWRPRNNFMVSDEELLMIPGINNIQKEIQKYFCVNYLNRKFNIRMLNEKQLSLFLPFLSLDESKLILQNINSDLWKNSQENQNSLVITKNLSLGDLRNEIEQVTGKMISIKDSEYLNNVALVSKSINAEIKLQTKEKKQWNSIAKFEIGLNNKVKLIYRFGPSLN